MHKTPLKVCVTGAAGQIAYSLLPLICSGQCFPSTPIELSLLDIAQAMPALEGVVMELNDCAYPLLTKVRTYLVRSARAVTQRSSLRSAML